eukprot:TRINITY_DN16442_c0_g1_i1.p2 TRINITY_DN16442_c0_g1~~TRINITY_DN16442_c0_g1_i1.p2  ORF type:complete len:263 (+),score=98.89 TRINITY_DN16442_c0_g1_i1:82-789(+)
MGPGSAVAVYWPASVAVFTVLIAAVWDPNTPELLPPTLDPERAPRFLLSPWFLACAALGSGLLVQSGRVAARLRLPAEEHFAMVWWSLNVSWFQTGCDILSGLFGVMPNLSECYKKLNRDHALPMHHEHRVVMDVIYWFELLIEVPLAVWLLQLYFQQSPRRHAVEMLLCGMHLAGLVAYYIPDLVLGEYTSVITWLDRLIACCWIGVPAALFARALRRADGTPALRAPSTKKSH